MTDDDELAAAVTAAGREGQVAAARADAEALKAFFVALRSGPKPWVPIELAKLLTVQRQSGETFEVWLTDDE
jgi:hypothetical protein